jgi:diguanylate cyclase (GGDEF)-like protein
MINLDRNRIMQTRTSTVEMIRDLKEAKGIFQTYEQADTRKIFNPDVQQQIMLDISMRLQQSLEVEWVFQNFMEVMQSFLLFDGYNYQVSEPGIHLEIGRQKGHHFLYKLSIEDSNLGELVVYRGRKFSEEELEFFENVLCALMYPLRNAIHFRQATMLAHKDALTGVNNRSTFDNSLEREINLARRQDVHCSMLMIDIDLFKNVNDTYGHSAGDAVIKAVAETIQKNVRTTDLVFRYGGEEFVAILNNADCEKAYVIADRVLEAVREVTVEYQKQVLSVSVSIGLACLDTEDTASALFDRADSALYKAKNDGRDQICIAAI